MGIDIVKAASALADLGIELNDEQKSLLAGALETKFREAAEEIVKVKLATTDEKKKVSQSEAWAKRLFSLAEGMSKDLISKEVNRGRGRVSERVLNDVETPFGKLKVSLSEIIGE